LLTLLVLPLRCTTNSPRFSLFHDWSRCVWFPHFPSSTQENIRWKPTFDGSRWKPCKKIWLKVLKNNALYWEDRVLQRRRCLRWNSKLFISYENAKLSNKYYKTVNGTIYCFIFLIHKCEINMSWSKFVCT
jgi:hypothetical protein